MDQAHTFPNLNRLSIVVGVIVLFYATIPFVQLPAEKISINLPLVVFALDINFGVVISLFVAFLAALGTDWLIQSHPIKHNQSLLQHGFIPALTAWVIGVPLNSLESGPEWWIVLTLGAGLLVLVLISEYIVVDKNSSAHLPASMGLTIVSFALYLMLAIAVKASSFRLFLMAPALVFTLSLLILRALFLRTQGGIKNIYWTAAIAIFVGQIVIGLHYLPLKPLTFGLIIVAIALGLTIFAINFEEGQQGRLLWFEPVLLMFSLLTLAIIIPG
ncbi:MAG: hypothetical protein BGO78_04320 [Chloroflexi bacterium 44-23]|nr:MAG: hypothetical protein BGO78_04320 [Chloroflexi bacterium 44-23]